jgi:mono/diheme cytochrome c family protein
LEKHQNSRDRIDKDIVIDATIQFTTSLCQIQMNSIKRNAQVLFMLISSLVFLGGQSVRADQRQDFFEAKIRPVLIQKCFKCHGDTKASGGFRVDSRERLLKGGDSGPAIVPGKPVESRLIHAIQRQGDASEMPPEQDQALRADEVANFVTWIKSGAFWPAQSAKFESVKHWAYEPIRNVDPPKVQDKAWANTSVDPFIQRRQEEQGVLHAPTADKRTLIRRATFDLTGLPPTPDETTAFIQTPPPMHSRQ